MRSVRPIIAINAIVAIIATVALVISLINTNQQADINTRAIRESSYNTCKLIGNILASLSTPQDAQAYNLILKLNPELSNCAKYADQFH
jgi:hypothetical protein